MRGCGSVAAATWLAACVLLAGEVYERVEVRWGTVDPPGEPHGDRWGVADDAIGHAGTRMLGSGGLGGDADGLAGGDGCEPLLDAVDGADGDGGGRWGPQI